MRRVVSIVLLLATAACGPSEEPPPVSPPAIMASSVAPGDYQGTVTAFPDHAPDLGTERETPQGRGVEQPARASVTNLHAGSGADLATLTLVVGDDRLETEVILLPRADRVELQATREVVCGSVRTGGGTLGHVSADELVIEQLRLEQACTLGGQASRLWRFRGPRTSDAARP